MAIITISRQNGSLGDELADYLAGKLNCEIISRAYAMENFFGGENDDDEDVAEKLSDSAKFFLSEVPGGSGTYKDLLIRKIEEFADESENLIVLGLGGCVILQDRTDVVNIRVYAGLETRTKRIARRYNVTEEEAESTISIGDRKHKRFVSILFEKDLAEPSLYDLTLNTDEIGRAHV